MAAYSMPFSARDVLGSYPSAQLSAVDRDTQIFRFGQVLTKSKSQRNRLIAGKALSQVSPDYQEAQIERLAGDNFSAKQFQNEQRESMALQKQYIQDRTAGMEQKTNQRLLRQTLVKALGSGSGSRTPFSELEIEEQLGSGSGSGLGTQAGSGASTPESGGRGGPTFLAQLKEQERQARSGRAPRQPGGWRATLGLPADVPVGEASEALAMMEGGLLTSSFWGQQSIASSASSRGDFDFEEEEYGLGVEPVSINIDPKRLEQLEILRADVLGNRLREGAIGSLVGDMVQEVSRGEAVRQYQEQISSLSRLFENTPEALGEIANPGDFTERDLRTLARAKSAARSGFFGRSELRSEQTYAASPLEQESAFASSIEAEFGYGSANVYGEQLLDTQFGNAGSMAIAGGGVRPRGRPAGYKMSEESKAKIGQTRRAKQTGAAAEAMIERGLISGGRAGIARALSVRGGAQQQEQGEGEEFPFSLFD